MECVSYGDNDEVTVRTYREITVTVNEVDLNVSEDLEYVYKFKAADLATNDAVKAWNSNGITATFSENFDWINGGLKSEVTSTNQLQQAFVIKAGTSMTINHKMFATEPMNTDTGMCFKIAFKTENVRDYDAQWLTCYNNGRGIKMSAHNAIVQSTGSLMTTPYEESSYIEYEAEVYRRDNRNDGVTDESAQVPEKNYIMAWLDGIPSNIKKYSSGEAMLHPNGAQASVTIGSPDCDVWLYLVKFYQKSIEMQNHVDNFIMDAPNSVEMMERYARNDILDDTTQEIDYEKLADRNKDLRIYLYDIPYLTLNKIKKDPVANCKFQQIWRNGDVYYQLTGNCIMGIQGTSSYNYRYGAANTDSKFTELHDGYGNDLLAGGVQNDKSPYGNNWYEADPETGNIKVYEYAGEELGPECIAIERDENRNVVRYIKALGYKVNDNSCPISYSNIKVNYASCEQVNNYCNAMWYQRFQPYPSLSPRDCMEFSMGIQFIKDSGVVDADHIVLFGDDRYHMYSIANMGTSKNNVHVFHDVSNPNEACVEIKYNGKPYCDMIAYDPNLSDWDTGDYFEARYQAPGMSEETLDTAWKRVWKWMYDSNPMAATNDPIPAETYGEYTFRGHDRPIPSDQSDRYYTQVLRGTKVKQYAGTYTTDSFERRMAKMLSECEDYLVMDSFVYHFLFLERHTAVDNVAKNNFWSTDDLVHWDLSKAYDMDTSDGNNNEGIMSFDYGNEFMDADENGKKVFNSTDSVWWVFIGNLYEACQTMFINRESVGAWNATAYTQFLRTEQKKVPERCWVQCYWYDYIRTYENRVTGVQNMLAYLDGGTKTHQRNHYETFQEIYMSGKYNGSAASSKYIRLRGYTPAVGSATREAVPPRPSVQLKMYNKFYASVDVDGTIYQRKFEKGEVANIDFLNATLGDTVIRISPAGMIQEIGNLAALYGGDYAFGDAKRLRSLTLGSSIEGYSNTNFFDLSLGGNPMLEYLYVQNLKNGTNHIVGNLDLSNCPALLEVDATGSDFTGVTFADGGLINKAIIKRPTTLTMLNLNYLDDTGLSIADYTGITGLRVENTPGIDVRNIINAIPTDPVDVLDIVRLIGMDWTRGEGGTDTTFLDRIYSKHGRNEGGDVISQSVLAGEGWVSVANSNQIRNYNTAWPNFDLTVQTVVPQFLVTYVDLNERTGETTTLAEVWVDSGSSAPDIVATGLIPTPTREPDAESTYIFTGKWGTMNGYGEIVEGLPQYVQYDTTIYAIFESTLREYTVQFWISEGIPYGDLITGLHYGDSLDPPETNPTWTDDEYRGIYRVFMSWDKSTGYIRGNMDVYAIWDTGTLIQAGSKASTELTPAELYAIHKAVPMEDMGQYFDIKDAIEITTGRDYEYTNVEKKYIVGTADQNPLIEGPLYLDGTASSVREVNIRPFESTQKDWTMAIEFELASDSNVNATLINLGYGTNGSIGARIRRDGDAVSLEWGNTVEVLAYGFWHGMVVLRHRANSNSMYVYAHNRGQTSASTWGYSIIPMRNSEIQKVRSTSATTSNNIVLGAVKTNDGYVANTIAKGWIYSMSIYYDDIGPHDAMLMGNWFREKWRFVYYGAGLEQLPDESSQVCKTSWVMDGLLERKLTHALNRDTSLTGNEDGWRSSSIRTFFNDACIKAMPEWLSDLIKPVTVYSTSGLTRNTLVYSNDKLYAIAYNNIYQGNFTGTAAPYRLESPFKIPFYGGTNPANKYNVKWAGYQGIDTENCIMSDSDPTLQDGAEIKAYDIWFDTGRSCYYMYIPADISSKHDFEWRRVNTSFPSVEAADGGLWLVNTQYHLRTPQITSSTQFITTYPTGGFTNYSQNSNLGLMFAFSIY